MARKKSKTEPMGLIGIKVPAEVREELESLIPFLQRTSGTGNLSTVVRLCIAEAIPNLLKRAASKD